MSMAGEPLTRRRAGVLLHPSSLPGPGARGTLGPDAERFVGFLGQCRCSVWQTLPLGPPDHWRSPYQSPSAHAGDPGLIDLSALVRRGWLAAKEWPLARISAHPAHALA